MLCSFPGPLPPAPALSHGCPPCCGVVMSVSSPIKSQPGHKAGTEAPRRPCGLKVAMAGSSTRLGAWVPRCTSKPSASFQATLGSLLSLAQSGLVVRFGPESPPMPGYKPLPAGQTRGTPRLDLSHRTLSGRFWSQPRGPIERPAQAAPRLAAAWWGWSCANRRPTQSVTRQGAWPTESEALAPGPGTEPAHPGCPIQTGSFPPASGQRVPPDSLL